MTFDQIGPGHAIPGITRSPQRKDLIRFAAVAEDFAEQHWDKEHMAALGFPNVIVHGWLTLTYMCQAVTAWMPPDIVRIVRYDARHKRPALPGPMRIGGSVTGVRSHHGKRQLDLAIWARDEDGNDLTTGTMVIEELDREEPAGAESSQTKSVPSGR